MIVTKEQVDPCTIRLDIEVDPDTIGRAFDRAYREFGGFTNVPGFRPGKAPRNVLARYVNQTRLRERVIEIVASPAYKQAIKQEEITPYSDPDVEFSDLAEGRPWQIKATVPMPPQVTLGDYSDIEVERPVYAVTDAEIDRSIETIREEHARLVLVSDRGIQPEDVVIAETLITTEGQPPPAEPRRTLIRIGNNIPGFDEAVMGQMPEEERTFELTYPDDYQEPELAGKTATFNLKVHSINQRVLPEVTDEWVKETTAYESVQHLRETIREKLKANYDDLANRVAEARIIDQLVERSTLLFPRVMVEEDMQDAREDLGKELEKRGMTMQEYLDASGVNEQEYIARARVEAEKRVKSFLALKELAIKEEITTSDEEIDAEFDQLTSDSELKSEDRERLKGDGTRRNQVFNMIVRRKVRDLLLSKAKIKDVATKTSVEV